MKCDSCQKNAVFLNPTYCSDHYARYFEKKTLATIRKYGLFREKDRIAVAVSGGKDSMSLLNLLFKHDYNVTALSIDEGIKGYRDRSLIEMKSFCKKNKIPYKVISFKMRVGRTLDDILKDKTMRPCTVCGILRRYLLNAAAKEFDVLATAHNMDDECQAIIMNLIKSNMNLLQRQGPVTGLSFSTKFTKRVKPFYMMSEKEIKTYSVLNKLSMYFGECPYVERSFRLKIRDLLNEYEFAERGTKNNILNWFLDYKKSIKPNDMLVVPSCHVCGEPSTGTVCNACKYALKIKE